MGVWAAWSLMRFLPDGQLVVHMDGEWADADVARFMRLMPGTRMIARGQAHRAVGPTLEDLPHIKMWRQTYRYGLKLIDPHLLGCSSKIILLDSDVLFLNDPLALKREASRLTRTFAWNADVETHAAVDVSVLDEIAGAHVPRNFNSGLVVAPRFGRSELEVVEDVISGLLRRGVDMSRLWLEQSVLATVVGRLGGGSAPLPRPYDVHEGVGRKGQVARHYVGAPLIRPRFFTEGVPLVLSQASSPTSDQRPSESTPLR